MDLVTIKCASSRSIPALPISQSPTMPVTIDHTAYPGIMDLIVDNVCHRTLVTLRTTCRDMDVRVRRLMADAVLDLPTLRGPVTLHTRRGRQRQLPFLPGLVRALESANDATVGRFTAMHTLRRHVEYRTDTRPAHTVVDFIDVGVHAPHAIMRTSVSAHRCVMHFRYDPSSTDDLCLRVMVQHDGVREWVFVLEPATPAPPEWPPAFLFSALACALWDWDGRDGVCVTLVGGHWATADELWADMVQGFTHGRGARPAFVQRPELAPLAVAASRLLTRDAWLEELGERSDVEATWPVARI